MEKGGRGEGGGGQRYNDMLEMWLSGKTSA